jgi:branched-chain amino acid transport system ATP-binding protein
MMLRVHDLEACYGSAKVLHGISVHIGAGEIVCLIGRNGAGKTTTLKSIMGLARVSSGQIVFLGDRIEGRSPYQIARLGIAYVPEDRRIFGSLTVEENVRVAAQAANHSKPQAVQNALEMFPDLIPKLKQLASSLSGGQQQMLAIARAVATGPRLLLLDEPTEGLSPSLVQSIRLGITESRKRGISILLVEQNLSLALAVGDVMNVLSRGTVVFRGTASELLAQPSVIAEHLGVGRVKQMA